MPIPPFIVAAGAGRRETAIAVVASVVLALLAGIMDGFFGSFQHLFRVGLGALAGLLAIRVAVMRERADLVSSLDRDVGRVLAESREVREATPRLLETVARELGWDAATLWEVEGREGRTCPRPCVAGTRNPLALHERRRASTAAWGFRGVCWPAASRRGSPTSGGPRSPTRGAAAAGVRAAAAFPITGTRGVRGRDRAVLPAAAHPTPR